MSKNTQEILTGLILGLILGILFFSKLAFGAELTPEDEELLAQVVELESGNQDLMGKRLVVAVVINRVESPDFPDSVQAVLSQPRQFVTYSHLSEATPSWHDRLAVRMELENSINEEVRFFRTNHYGCGQPLFVHGEHYFSK